MTLSVLLRFMLIIQGLGGGLKLGLTTTKKASLPSRYPVILLLLSLMIR